MSIIYSNFIKTKLKLSLLANATIMSVPSADVPDVPVGSHYYLSVIHTDYTEIVKVTAKSGDILTIERAQDGTTAHPFPAGCEVILSNNKLATEEYIKQTIGYSAIVSAFDSLSIALAGV